MNLCDSINLKCVVGCSKIKLSVWERIEMKSADHAHPKNLGGFYVFITVCPIC